MTALASSTALDAAVPPPVGVREGAFGNATHLACRACGEKTQLGPFYACMECFGPLEVGYDFPTITREQIEAGPKSIWRYAPAAARSRGHRHLPVHRPRLHPAGRRRQPRRRPRAEQLWVKDDSGNPTHSFKDRVVAVALSAARELGLQVLACPSTGNLANAVAAAAARAGIQSVVFVPEEPRAAEDHRLGGLRHHADRHRRQLRRRQQAGQRDRRRGGGLGVRQRERPALLRRGLQDPGLRDRRAARLAAARPGRGPGRHRLAADQDRQGLRRAGQARVGRGQAGQDLRRPGHRLLADRPGLPRRPRLRAAGQAQHHRQVLGHWQPG